jgi:cytosine/adenosine deaminase-related metal-dependent hydrolase
MKTWIENGVIIAWIDGRHQVLEGAVVVFEKDLIVHVGPANNLAPGPDDIRINAQGRIVMPGLVNTHLHVTDTMFTKGYLEESSQGDQLRHAL